MPELGSTVKAILDCNYGIKKGDILRVTSKAKDYCVLDGCFLLSVLDLKNNFSFVV